MKVVIRKLALAAVAAGLLLPAAVRGECTCREPEKPELPPRNADAREMAQAGREIEAYVAGMKAYRACLAKCITDADASLSGYIEGWNHQVENYNKRDKWVPKGLR
jgi:hypothetical protein